MVRRALLLITAAAGLAATASTAGAAKPSPLAGLIAQSKNE
jgi:hypothetical protein